MSNFLSYSNIFKDRELFRKSGTKSGGDFNYTDTPGTKYFKIFFYFMNGDSEKKDENSGGLLAPTWLRPVKETDLYQYNSAWSYLKMNCEDERADRLENFVNLLSNISAESPWYFSEISGIDTALERKVSEKDFKIEETRKKISIKCLSDPYDDRISTLLDLYRAIVWDWQSKREIVPANLRKFDMGIFIYNDPIIPFHKMSDGILSDIFKSYEYAGIGETNSEYKTSYKYIEFHNCEFDYDSSKSGLSTLTNKEGIMPEYNIDIFFDDCYEERYNEFLLQEIGDYILQDTSYSDSTNILNDPFYNEDLEKRLNFFDKGFLTNLVGQVANVGVDAAKGLVNRALLGNLYTFSLTKMAKQLKGIVEGDVWSTARGVSEYIKDAKQRKENQVNIGHSLFTEPQKTIPSAGEIGDIFEDPQPNQPVDQIGNMFDNTPKKIRPSIKRIGNLAKSQTIANNL